MLVSICDCSKVAAMTERPILFSGPMVRAILDGRKTQTRRVVKPQPEPGYIGHFGPGIPFGRTEKRDERCPYGYTGDWLLVREAFHPYHWDRPRAAYRADGERQRVRTQIETYEIGRWKPSIHMPRWASRILLEIVSVRVERLQEIGEADCWAEGIDRMPDTRGWRDRASEYPREAYADLWEQINGSGSWSANPWVWVVEFKVLKP